MIASMPDYSLTLPSWSVGENALDKKDPDQGQPRYVLGCQKDETAEKKPLVKLQPKLDYNGRGILKLGFRIGKPVYAFPTIASTCAACTAVAILYHPDGSFSKPCFLPAPPAHTFVDTEVIASAPPRYLWAGLGDTCAKYFEATMSSRGDELAYYHALGVSVSRSCMEPLLRYGEKAFQDHKEKNVTEELTQVILTIIVTTAVASILLTADKIIDYNTGLAHAIFYALTAFPELHLERDHLHGEVVGFGVLILLLADGQKEMFQKMLAFNRSVGLPTRLEDIGVTEADLEKVLPKVLSMPDIAHNPYPVTLDMLAGAFRRLQDKAKEA